jgi:hypothetical protein
MEIGTAAKKLQKGTEFLPKKWKYEQQPRSCREELSSFLKSGNWKSSQEVAEGN